MQMRIARKSRSADRNLRQVMAVQQLAPLGGGAPREKRQHPGGIVVVPYAWPARSADRFRCPGSRWPRRTPATADRETARRWPSRCDRDAFGVVSGHSPWGRCVSKQAPGCRRANCTRYSQWAPHGLSCRSSPGQRRGHHRMGAFIPICVGDDCRQKLARVPPGKSPAMSAEALIRSS